MTLGPAWSTQQVPGQPGFHGDLVLKHISLLLCCETVSSLGHQAQCEGVWSLPHSRQTALLHNDPNAKKCDTSQSHTSSEIVLWTLRWGLHATCASDWRDGEAFNIQYVCLHFSSAGGEPLHEALF